MSSFACRTSPRLCRPLAMHFLVIAAACFFIGLGSTSVQAQGFDATKLSQPTDLVAIWLVHAGDDPAYARPDFDDSKWMPFNSERQSLRDLFPQNHPETIWYRLHLKVAKDEKGMGMYERAIFRNFEIYSNGELLFRAGKFDPYVPYVPRRRSVIPIPDRQIATGTVVLALRLHINAGDWVVPRPGYGSNLKVGQLDVLREHMWYAILTDYSFTWIDDLLDLSILAGALLLYSTQRQRSEYLWLALFIVATTPFMIREVFLQFHGMSQSWATLSGSLWVLWPYFEGRMYCAFARHRPGWRLQTYLVLACVALTYQELPVSLGGEIHAGVIFSVWPETVLLVAVLPVILIADIRRDNRQTSLLLVPLLISGLSTFSDTLTTTLALIRGFNERALHFVALFRTASIGPFSISYSEAADVVSMLSLALIILVRSNQLSRQQALLEGELAGAREVQQVILPEAVEVVPGFRIESVYAPARQVGGDFFQILPVGEGGVLVVVGDVAGKGLPAAMLVSVLVGSIRTAAEDTHDPALILRKLNDRLLGRVHGGFSTALAAHIAADGGVTIANAGHLSPYLDGKEIELPGALPLGVVNGVSYETTRFHLPNGSGLTFYSDGVVEAQNRKGELFGFDRAREVSTQPAAAIVDAAKQFGQEDDITVVTLARESVEASASTLLSVPAQSV